MLIGLRRNRLVRDSWQLSGARGVEQFLSLYKTNQPTRINKQDWHLASETGDATAARGSAVPWMSLFRCIRYPGTRMYPYV